MIAMAIACNPRLLIADEPTTALDVTIQAQILDLLLELQRQRGMALILITHDMAVVAETAQSVVVQYAGQQAEVQEVRGLFDDPMHPYTEALLAALPERATARRLPTIPGVVPGAGDRPSGCLFHPRCRNATELLRARASRRSPTGPRGKVRCHYPLTGGVPAHHPGYAVEFRVRSRRCQPSLQGCGRYAAEGLHVSDAVALAEPAGWRERGALVLEAQGPGAPLPGRARHVQGQRDPAGAARRLVRDVRRAHARGGRRIRLRQEHARPPRDPDRGAERRHAQDRRRRRHRTSRARPSASCARRCRSCSRTPTARSTRGRRSAASSTSR